MRKFILLSAATLFSAVVSAQTVARMDDLKPEQKSMAVSLKLTGELTTTGNRLSSVARPLFPGALRRPQRGAEHRYP